MNDIEIGNSCESSNCCAHSNCNETTSLLSKKEQNSALFFVIRPSAAIDYEQNVSQQNYVGAPPKTTSGSGSLLIETSQVQDREK